MTTAAAPKLDAGTQLAIDRTRLAYERTMMAWLRTAASLISFGFTIYKFFQFELKTPAEHAQHLIGPRGFALIMISTGLTGLLLAAIQHRSSLKLLREMYGDQPRSVAGIVAWFVALLGVLALIAVLVRA
jgi:inner membrane protein YidH